MAVSFLFGTLQKFVSRISHAWLKFRTFDLTPIDGSSIFTNPVKAPEIWFSCSRFRKQHPHAVIKNSLTVAVYKCSCERISRGDADYLHSLPYQGRNIYEMMWMWSQVLQLSAYIVKSHKHSIRHLIKIISIVLWRLLSFIKIMNQSMMDHHCSQVFTGGL